MKFKQTRQTDVRQRPQTERSTKNVYSYYNNQPSGRREPVVDKTINLGETAHRLRLAPTIIAIVVIVGSILFSLTIAPKPQVDFLEGQEPYYRSSESYAESASELIGGSLGNRTKLTIDTKKIEQQLLSEFPELRAAVLRLSVLGRKPTLVLDIRRPSMLLISSKQSLVLDSSGVVVSEARGLNAETLASLLVVHDQSDIELKSGLQAVTTETVKFIEAVRAQMEAKGLKISKLTLPSSANQLDVQLEGLDYYIKMNISSDARLQAGGFHAVKESLEGKGVTPQEYIDVRVEEKVFYK